ncbi:MAG TPA: wax ester/triacylglycerol synthase domain-containing protein [Acidimicrobiia bacterium]
MPHQSIERLSSSDMLMLWPDEFWPQDVAALAYLDGSSLFDADGQFRIGFVRQAVAERLHMHRRLRQVIYVPPSGLGNPLWIDDAGFDVANHVRVHALDPDADEAVVLQTVEQLRLRRLDPSHPLWELWFLPGLADRRVALYMRLHHAMADGMAALIVLGALLDLEPGSQGGAGIAWKPLPPPTETEIRDDHARRRRHHLSSIVSVLGHPVKSLERLVAFLPAIGELVARRPGPDTPLNHVVGPSRRVALVRADLEVIKDLAGRHGGTVNDALLATIAGGLRRWLLSRDVEVEKLELPVYVPVSLRHHSTQEDGGNQVAQMVVPLPLGESDLAERVGLIAAETVVRKARSRPSISKLPHTGQSGRLMVKVLNRQRVNVTTADLAGPPVRLYMAGAPLLEVFPLLPLIGPVSLGIGALSYAGAFNLGLVADPEAIPDVGLIAAAMAEELSGVGAGR